MFDKSLDDRIPVGFEMLFNRAIEEIPEGASYLPCLDYVRHGVT